MSESNARHNRVVWFDLPVVDLQRSAAFYREVLAVSVELHDFDGFAFGVFEHDEGNGGCLVPNPGEVADDRGVLIYLNADGRIRAAVAAVEANGGSILEPIHSIGPHGFRAIVRDSEGNRVALHSHADA
ncbi:MAG: VOC family protein [Planctomycetota bacterium]